MPLIALILVILLQAASATPAFACACTVECPKGYICPDDVGVCVPEDEETS